MRKRKALITTMAAAILASALCFSSSADWKQDSTGWWYQYKDGSYPKGTWKQIDGRWYYFKDDGYLLTNGTTPDGYPVGADGAFAGTTASLESLRKEAVSKGLTSESAIDAFCMRSGSYIRKAGTSDGYYSAVIKHIKNDSIEVAYLDQQQNVTADRTYQKHLLYDGTTIFMYEDKDSNTSYTIYFVPANGVIQEQAKTDGKIDPEKRRRFTLS